MPFCPSCGAEGTGGFCQACGKPMSGAAASPAAGATTGGLEDNVASALCYALGLLTGVIFLVLDPYNKNKEIRFHAFQSIFAHIGLIVCSIGLGIVTGMMGAISGGLGLLLMPLWPAVGLACFVGWILMMVKTYQGSKIVLPVIGPLAQQQAG